MNSFNNRYVCRVIVFSLVVFAFSEAAYAAELNPLQEFVRSIWGKVVVYIAIVFLTAAVLYLKLRQKMAEAKAVKDLRFMAKHSPVFEWGNIRKRVTDCFYRYHAPWRTGDEETSGAWMSETYWRDFKSLFLDRVEQEGLVIVSNIKTVSEIKPLYFAHHNVGGKDEKSKLVVCVTAKLRNYLSDLATGTLVEGQKEYKETKTIWSFEISNGQWVISNIEDFSATEVHLKNVADLPNIEETLLKPVKVMTATQASV